MHAESVADHSRHGVQRLQNGVCNAYSTVGIIIVTLRYINVRLALTLTLILKFVISSVLTRCCNISLRFTRVLCTCRPTYVGVCALLYRD